MGRHISSRTIRGGYRMEGQIIRGTSVQSARRAIGEYIMVTAARR